MECIHEYEDGSEYVQCGVDRTNCIGYDICDLFEEAEV